MQVPVDVAGGVVVGIVVAVAVLATTAWLHRQGVTATGDEPTYLATAFALAHSHSLSVASAYRYALAHRLVPGLPGSPSGWQLVFSHGRAFPYHEPGLAIVLAPAVALGGVQASYVLLAVLTGVAVGWLSVAVGRLSDARSPGRVAAAGVFLFPASLLAATQVYPDLLSGLAIAVVVVLLATMERRGRSSWWQLVVAGVLLGFLPWLHIQNALYAGLLAVALVVVHWRRRLRWWPLAVGLGLAVCGWALMALYDSYVYGHWQGPANNVLTWGALSWTRILALVVDRQQGMLVQLPVVLLGLAALVVLRRRFPVTAVSTVVVAAAVVLVSGASGNSFGGASFVGRFDWAAFPVLLSFAALYLVELWRRRRWAATAVTVVAGVLALLQGAEVLRHHHAFYSTSWLTPPRPAGPGWWGRLDSLLPSFSQLTPAWATPRVVWAVLWEGAAAALVVVVAAQLLAVRRRPPLSRMAPVLVAPVALSVAAAVTLGETAGSAAQRMSPMVAPAASLYTAVGHRQGANVVVEGTHTGALVYGPYWILPDGRYRATVHYALADPDPAAALVQVALTPTSPSGGDQLQGLAQTRLLPSRAGRSSLWFTVGAPGLLEVRVLWFGSGRLAVSSVVVDQG